MERTKPCKFATKEYNKRDLITKTESLIQRSFYPETYPHACAVAKFVCQFQDHQMNFVLPQSNRLLHISPCTVKYDLVDVFVRIFPMAISNRREFLHSPYTAIRSDNRLFKTAFQMILFTIGLQESFFLYRDPSRKIKRFKFLRIMIARTSMYQIS